MLCDYRYPIYWEVRDLAKMENPGMMTVAMNLNGQSQSAVVEPRTLLVHMLREELGMTGTHVGCDTSQCGACTVLIDGLAVKSCTVLAVQAEGCDVTTIEGIGDIDNLHAVQEGFWERHGLQCGFCTPGVIMTAVGLLQQNPNPTDEEIREGLEGVICRCTGYQNIVHAVRYAADKLQIVERDAEVAAATGEVSVSATSYEGRD